MLDEYLVESFHHERTGNQIIENQGISRSEPAIDTKS